YINEKWGFDTLLAMLNDFGTGADTPSVIRKELKIEPAEFDTRFLAFIEADTKNVVEHFAEWKKQLKALVAKVDAMSAPVKETVAVKDGVAIKLTQDCDAVMNAGAAMRDL